MTSIYVRGFAKKTGERDLQKLFEEIGSVSDVRMVRDFAFVTFRKSEDGEEAVKKMNGETFEGHTIRVEIAKEKPGPKTADLCYKCGKKGHWQANCPKRRKRRSRSSDSQSSSSDSSDSSSSSPSRKHKKKKKVSKRSKKHKKRYSSSRSRSSDSSSVSQQSSHSAQKKKKKH